MEIITFRHFFAGWVAEASGNIYNDEIGVQSVGVTSNSHIYAPHSGLRIHSGNESSLPASYHVCSQRSEPRLTFALQTRNEGVKPELSYLFSALGLTASLVSFCDVLHSALRLRLTFAAQIGNDSSFRPGS